MSHWETLDVESLMHRQNEQTVSGNAGGYAVPIGQPLRRKFPISPSQYKPVKAESDVSRQYSADPEYAWALSQVK